MDMLNDAETIRDLAAAGTIHQVPKGARFALVPEGYSVEDLSELQPQPVGIAGSYSFRDTRSLAAYLERFELPQSIAFSDPAAHRIQVQIDHHDHAEGTAGASHCRHTATFAARFTAEYAAWREISGKPMSQVKAGMFLEERAVDVIEPDSATIMDLVMTFDALKKVTFRQSTRLHDGRRQFTYQEENEVRGDVTLPEQIKLRVPVFEGQEPDVIPVRVRYRIDDGQLVFSFEIHDRDKVEMIAFERCEDALCAERTGLLLLRSA